MAFLKQNWKKIGIGFAILFLGFLFFGSDMSSKNQTGQILNRADSIEGKALREKIYSLAVDEGRFEEAIKEADTYIDIYGDDLDVWIHRGMSYYQLGDCANAAASLYHADQMHVASEFMSIEDVQNLLGAVLNSKLCK